MQPMIARIANIRLGKGVTRCSKGIIALVVVLLLSTPAAAADQDQPYVPLNDNTVLEHLPSTSDPRVRQFDALKKQLEARPADVKLGVALARAYLDYGRDTGDARYLGRAQAIIAPWVGTHPRS